MMNEIKNVSVLLAAGLLMTTSTLAQDGASEEQPENQTGTEISEQPEAADEQTEVVEVEPAEPEAPIFTDPEFEKIAGLMAGSWGSVAPIATTDGETSDVLMSAAPIRIEGMQNTLYAEFARADEPEMPYRVVVMELHRVRGEVRLRTYAFRGEDDQTFILGLAGSFAFPEPRSVEIKSEDLFATLDIPLRASGDGYSGRTPHPFPTTVGGAVEYKGAIEITPDRFFSAERGYAADGSIAWGAEPEDALEFERIDSYVTVDARDTGLVIVTYSETEFVPATPGDYLIVHYVGAVADGRLFQSSIEAGEPYRFEFPGRHIAGWNSATEGMGEGTVRRVFVPFELGYGARDFPNSPIDAFSALTFVIYGIAVEPAGS